jgi:hypothetical protein
MQENLIAACEDANREPVFDFPPEEKAEMKLCQEYVNRLVPVNPQVVWIFKQQFSESYYTRMAPPDTPPITDQSNVTVITGARASAPVKELAEAAARAQIKTKLSKILKPRELVDRQEKSASWGKVLGYAVDIVGTDPESQLRKEQIKMGWWVSFQAGHPIQGGSPLFKNVVRIGVNDIIDMLSEEDFLKYVYHKE